MSTATVTIAGQTSVPGGPSIQVGPIVITSSAPINQITEITLSSGDNSITIPTGTTLIVVQLPTANAIVTKLAGATSGTSYAIAINPAGGVVSFEPSSSQSVFVLNAASAHALPTTITFI